MNIQSEAERIYPYNVEIMSERDLIMRAKKEAFIAGATYEQERSKPVIEALQNLMECYERDKHLLNFNVNTVRQALNTYNNE
jgi:hypothetical protein